jgi:hypothetical protein
MSQIETVQPQIAETERSEHQLRNRFVAVVAAGTMCLTMTGCENPFGEDTAKTVQVEAMFPDAVKKTAELNGDPSFRAESITLLDGPSMIGSASLVKNPDGSYALATIEHVARPMFGMKPMVESHGLIAQDKNPEKAAEPLYAVPGIGLLKVTAEQPNIEGEEVPDANGGVDRYTTISIDDDQQRRLAEAEANGVLSVPEKVPLSGSFGDVVTMPLGETGQAVPFVFLYQNENHTQATLVPLYVLNQQLDYEQGMATLNERAQAVLGANPPAGQTAESSNILDIAVTELQTALIHNAKTGTLDPLEAAKSLPCMGDSGSAFLNQNGDILGTLSSGQQFYEYGTESDPFFDKAVINRDSAKPQLNRYCLSQVTISSPN